MVTTQSDVLRYDVQSRTLRRFRENPELSQRDLAKAVGISKCGIQYLLSALLNKGLLKLGSSTGVQDKRRYADILTRKDITVKTMMARIQPGDAHEIWADCTLLRPLTGYSPATNMCDCVARFVDWIKPHYFSTMV